MKKGFMKRVLAITACIFLFACAAPVMAEEAPAEGGGTIADTQEAAVKVIYIALAIIIVGGIINHIVKKRFYE